MKTSMYIRLFTLISILALATAKDTKSPKASKAPKAGKVVTVDDFKNPDKIITVEAEPLPQGPVWPPVGWTEEQDEGPGRRLRSGGPNVFPCKEGEDCPRPPVLEPEVASITEFGKKEFLAALAEEKFPIQRGPIGVVCTCPPYAAIFICIGFRSCDGCCRIVYEVDKEVA